MPTSRIRLGAAPALLLVACQLSGCDSPGAGAMGPAPAVSAEPGPVPAAEASSSAPPSAPPAPAPTAAPSASAASAVGSAAPRAPSPVTTTSASANPCEVRYEDKVGPDGKITRTMLPRDKSCSKGEGGRTKSGATLGY